MARKGKAKRDRPADSHSRGGDRTISVNRKAFHDYIVEESYEAGLVLTGTEIKSIRAGQVSLREAFARIDRGEAWLYGMHVAPYEHGNRYNHEPTRPRKLLLHAAQIRALIGKTKTQGLTLVPLRLYIKRDHAKVELALARGRRSYDKRERLAEREARRDIERSTKGRVLAGA